ncbi:S41 family peptidase [Niabella sp. CC-SYL272]|uniref:S41 family peptidase n=1 Tax=Niabella agricola TaxID=2891571 RepID=UPI001F21CE82|nr:S41 family peptidase [Niabella agricola]MCF3110980.1 S41 family peptidase [Niabella agricola]
MRRMLLLCLLLCCCCQLKAQTIYSQKQLEEDLKTFRHLLTHTNPILTKEERNDLDQTLSTTIKLLPPEGATALAFIDYIKASKINTGYDDHAGVFLGEQVFPFSDIYFPFPVHILDDRILVNTEKARVPFGSMILSINGMRTAEIVKKLAGEGDRNNFRRHKLSQAFPYVFYKEYGASNKFIIIYKDSINSRNEKSITYDATGLNGIKEEAVSAVFPLIRDARSGPFSVQTQFFPESKTYYLRLLSFGSVPDTYKQIERSFDSVFKDIRLKEVRNLILDIRENNGGLLDVPGLLFSYLTDSVVYETYKQKMLPVKNIPLDNLKQIDFMPTSSKAEAKKRMYRLYDGFTITNNRSEKEVRFKRSPSPYRFSGNTCLLVNGGTFSAATYFAALFKSHKRGPVFGSTVGGSIKGITAGHTLLYELPNTKIQVTLPLAYITFDDSLYHATGNEYIAPDTKVPFELAYPYFLKKLDWGININAGQ